jgi:hypothetical protein
MQVETALFFETAEQIYGRVFRVFRPRTPIPQITVEYRKFANATSRIRLENSQLRVEISDLLEGAPAPIQEALAYILIAKLFRNVPAKTFVARYRRYLNRTDVRRTLHLVKQERGRKLFRDPAGQFFDLTAIFADLNLRHFNGLMGQPQLGWSLRPSRTTLGHYDPSHNAIILTCLFDTQDTPEIIVRFVMFHEMLHLRYPTEHRGTRRCVHTKEFKIAEKQFEAYEEAKSELRRYLDQRSGANA